MKTDDNVVKISETTITIPTYGTSKPEKNPLFLENRVYQGSSGKVYPFPVTEKIHDQKEDKEYKAIILENQYIQITFLPELGGRIYRALDKTNNYDFVYYNHVIKPELVGLTGSWISGGIEFNWPQHHRPDTFLPVEYEIRENDDGSKTLWISDIDRMYGTKVTVAFTLEPDKAYLRLDETFSNPTDIPQTFLWWANPAVPVNEHTQSIFPPDVHAVFDHGKRAVSTFPKATGEYYKVDYSRGVDISRYKNVPVPTSYMAAHSNYDFLGNYDYQKRAGLLHVADHHVSPGKKQWTWGNGDFGQSWDHQLTDNDGPYIELMVGTYTDNQPDFTWLKPHEKKVSTEYFMPYKDVGAVKNATINAAINFEQVTDETAKATVYATSAFDNAHVSLYHNGELVDEEIVNISPLATFSKEYVVNGPLTDYKLVVRDDAGTVLCAYQEDKKKIEKFPDPAKAIPDPEKIETNDELYFAGQHLEQYRHATYMPDAYYREGLKRDPGDERINNAYGLLLYRRGLFAKSEPYFRRAIERQNEHNTNPYSGGPHYNLALSLMMQGKTAEAYDHFFKACWSYETQSVGYYNLALIQSQADNLQKALKFVNQALVTNYHDMDARVLKVNLLRRLGDIANARQLVEENSQIEPLNAGNLYEAQKLGMDMPTDLSAALNNKLNNYLALAELYIKMGQLNDAMAILVTSDSANPLKFYYLAYLSDRLGDEARAMEFAKKGQESSPDYVFPNRLFDVLVLEFIIRFNPEDGLAPYYLGNFFYDRRVYDQAALLWTKATELNPDYGMAYRNLAIVSFNKMNDPEKAQQLLEKAFTLDPENSRLVSELDTIYQKLNVDLEKRIAFLEKHMDLVKQRDDSYVSLITLLNETGQYQKAYDLIMDHIFHPWEGGEGKVSTQYEYALVELAKKDLANNDPQAALAKLQKALTYPRSIGEGKLPIAVDNIINYYLGLAYRMAGDEEAAVEHFEKATKGLTEPTAMMYYNDQPADTIFYQGLALEQLGRPDEAKARYYKLVNYGEHHLFDRFKMDYFAVSLPDALLLDEDYQTRSQEHCYYLMALGYLGLGDDEQAQKMFEKAAQSTNHHQGIIRHQHFEKPAVK